MKYRLAFCLILFLSVAHSWELDKEKNGIKVYTRKTETSDFKEYKGVVTINSNRKPAVEMVLQIADYVKWFPDCEESKLLEKVSSTVFIVYYRINTPWPASDRDAVIQMNLERDDEKNTTTIHFKDQLNYKNEVDGVVRVKNTSGYWQFIEGNGKTKIIYQCLTDPGGNIPSWVANLFVVDAPFKTLSAIKSKLE